MTNGGLFTNKTLYLQKIGCGSAMIASKLASLHSPCTIFAEDRLHVFYTEGRLSTLIRTYMMKIKRVFVTICAACAIGATSFAQTARQVLDQTANKLKNSGGIEATFEGTQFKGQDRKSVV